MLWYCCSYTRIFYDCHVGSIDSKKLKMTKIEWAANGMMCVQRNMSAHTVHAV